MRKLLWRLIFGRPLPVILQPRREPLDPAAAALGMAAANNGGPPIEPRR